MKLWSVMTHMVLVGLGTIAALGSVDPYNDSTEGYWGYDYRIFSPSTAGPENPLPLIIFLHGRGGGPTPPVGNPNIEPLIATTMGIEFPAFLVVPGAEFWDPIVIRSMVEKLLKEFPIDERRIYVTGLSMGGNGSLLAATSNLDLLAAAVPLSMGGVSIPFIAQALGAEPVDFPLWMFHGDNDPIVPVEYSRGVYNGLTQDGKHPRYTELSGWGHGPWGYIYADEPGWTDTWIGGIQGDTTGPLYPWLFAQSRAIVPGLYKTIRSGETIPIDFGPQHFELTATSFWNVISIPPIEPVSILSALLTSDKITREVTLSISSGFEGISQSGVTSASQYPSKVIADSWRAGSVSGHGDGLLNPGRITLGNLPTDRTYTLQLLSSESGEDPGQNQLTRFIVNGKSADIKATDAANAVASVTDVEPDAEGNITITVVPSPNGTGRFAYLNALELTAGVANFNDWATRRGYDPLRPQDDQNQNRIPELMDYYFGNDGPSDTRHPEIIVSPTQLHMRVPIRPESATGELQLERSSSPMGPWTLVASFDFSTGDISEWTLTHQPDGMWLTSESLPSDTRSYYRVLGQ